jgi:CRP/FNR family transcriptional regulator, cyclic AMP receptor protein
MDKNHCLKEMNLFSTMVDKEVAELTRASRIFSVQKGETVFMQGDTSDSIYFLKEGIIKISRINADGRKLTIDMIRPGEFFGELCLAGERERRTIAEAMADSLCCEIKREYIEDYMKTRPDVALRLLKIIGDRWLALENLLEDMAFMDISTRVISLLLKYAEDNIVNIPLTHQEIADLTGSTRVSVSRSIAKLRKQGLIETSKEQIKLLNNKVLYDYLQYSSNLSY